LGQSSAVVLTRFSQRVFSACEPLLATSLLQGAKIQNFKPFCKYFSDYFSKSFRFNTSNEGLSFIVSVNFRASSQVGLEVGDELDVQIGVEVGVWKPRLL
jgi:hypothetical protein